MDPFARRLRRGAAGTLVALLGAWAVPARAAPGPAETMRPSASPYSQITTESSRVLPKWTPAASVLVEHGRRLSGRTPGALQLDTRTTTHVLMALGLFDWTELSLDLPVVVAQRGTGWVDGRGPGTAPTHALGDLRVGLKGTLLRTPRRGFGLGLSFDVTAPTGSGAAMTGTGRPSYAPQLLIEQRTARGIVAAVNVGYLARRDIALAGVVFGDAITYRAAIRDPARPRGSAGGGRGARRLGRARPGQPQPAGDAGRAALAAAQRGDPRGLRRRGTDPRPRRRRRAGHGLGRLGPARRAATRSGRSTAAVPPNAIAIARIDDRRATEPESAPADPDDPDGDGVLASADRCPAVAEDLDRFEDDDGCPELDDDHDGLRDAIDLCPRAPELVNGYLDWDGCPDRRFSDGRGRSLTTFDPDVLLPRIEFENRDATLGDAAAAEVDALAEILRLNPWIEGVAITPYVHATPDAAADRALARERARAVRARLLAAGVDPLPAARRRGSHRAHRPTPADGGGGATRSCGRSRGPGRRR